MHKLLKFIKENNARKKKRSKKKKIGEKGEGGVRKGGEGVTGLAMKELLLLFFFCIILRM
jgi:hypothetical protein